MKSLNYIIFITIISIYGCFGRKPTLETGHEGKPMPSMNLLLLDSSTHINTKNWKTNKSIVLIDISPYCPHCHVMVQRIMDNNQDLRDIEFLLLSSFPLMDLRNYYDKNNLKNYSNITLARDYEAYFGQYFQAPGVPCIAIYGKDRILKQVLMGKVSSSIIKDIASE